MKYLKYISLLLIISATLIHGQDYQAESPFEISIHSDFRTYSDETHVYVDASVTNRTEEEQQFYRFDVPYTTFQPIVYDMTGREAETTVIYRKDGHTPDMMIRGSKPRVVTLAPHETFTVRLNLADYYQLLPDRKYRVRLIFLPDASKKIAVGGRNIYYFTVDNKALQAEPRAQERGLHIATSISPSEILQLFFSAEKEERWRDYLKYIQPDEYIYSFPEYAGSYLAAPQVEKEKILADFTTYLIRNRPDKLLEYAVLKQTVQGNLATVQVKASRQAARSPFVYVYTFSLEKYKDYWKITGVEATLSRN